MPFPTSFISSYSFPVIKPVSNSVILRLSFQMSTSVSLPKSLSASSIKLSSMSKIVFPYGIGVKPCFEQACSAFSPSYIVFIYYFYKKQVISGEPCALSSFVLTACCRLSFLYLLSLLLLLFVDPERRCSSRTFRYGYLVTT